MSGSLIPARAMVATKGGLLFGMSGGYAFALHSTNWRVFLGSGTHAAPISFNVDGRQAIVVSSGRAVFMFGLTEPSGGTSKHDSSRIGACRILISIIPPSSLFRVHYKRPYTHSCLGQLAPHARLAPDSTAASMVWIRVTAQAHDFDYRHFSPENCERDTPSP